MYAQRLLNGAKQVEHEPNSCLSREVGHQVPKGWAMDHEAVVAETAGRANLELKNRLCARK